MIVKKYSILFLNISFKYKIKTYERFVVHKLFFIGAGDGNRTHVVSLEG